MTLRTRLIVAFLVLSVVPLGVVTVWSYQSNVKALREAASREANLLAGELSQRMQLVTASLTERVAHLVDLPPPPTVVRAANVKMAEAAPAAPPAATTPDTSETDDALLSRQVASALGEAAILLNNVELPGPRAGVRLGPPGAGAPGSQGRQSSSGSGGDARGGAGAGAQMGMLSGRGDANARGGGHPPPSGDAGGRAGNQRGRPPRLPPGADAARAATAQVPVAPVPAQPTPPPTPGVTPLVPSAPDAPPAGPRTPPDPNRIRVDVSGIWRDLVKDMVPSGRVTDLTSEQRATVAREVNQRLLGIKEGLKQSAAMLQKQAEAARQKATEITKSPDVTSPAATKVVAPATPAPAATTGAGAPAQGASAPTTAAPVTKKSALSGSRLDVTVEQNGEVVRKVNAEVNLPNLLMTVFAAVGRESGEVPFAVGADGRIYTVNDEDRPKVEALGAVSKPDGPLGRTVLPDWIVVTTKDPSGSGLRFGIARPVGDSLNSLRRTASLNAAVGLGFIGLAIVGIVPLSSRLTRNLSRLTDGVNRIAHGDYGARVEVKARDEVGTLARAFNQMAADVESHQRAVVGQERLKRELELGRQIQHDMLPHEWDPLESTCRHASLSIL